MKYSIGLIAWVLFMSYGIFKPGDPNDPPHLFVPGDDKLIHLSLFVGATLLFVLAMVVDWGIQKSKAVRIAWISGLLFASIAEPLQYFVPFRTPDLFDFISNVLGVVLGMVIYQRFFKSRNLPGYS